jgi:hypothetical protein
MGKVVIHKHPDVEKMNLERARKFLSLPIEEKLQSICSLIRLSVALNNGQPLKKPQGKGLIIRKSR